MTIKQLKLILSRHPDEMAIVLVNLNDDSGESNVLLQSTAITILQKTGEDNDPPEEFLAICHYNSTNYDTI